MGVLGVFSHSPINTKALLSNPKKGEIPLKPPLPLPGEWMNFICVRILQRLYENSNLELWI